MASSKNQSDYVRSLSGFYNEEDIVAIEEEFPGIFISDETDEYDGEIDLLVSEGGTPEKLRAYEVKDVGSLNQHTIVSHAYNAKSQIDCIEEYLENMGYSVEANYVINPEGHLSAVHELYESFGEKSFQLEDAKDIVSEPGRIPHISQEALEETPNGFYKIKEELKAVFEAGIIQP